MKLFESKRRLTESKVSDGLKGISDWRLENGYGLIFQVNGKKVGFVAYNNGNDTQQYPIGATLNISNLSKMKGIIDDGVIEYVKVNYIEEGRHMSKAELKDANLSLLIITNHNVQDFEYFKN